MRNIYFALVVAAVLVPDFSLAESHRGSKAERAGKLSRNDVQQNWEREYGYIPLDSGREAIESDERPSFGDSDEAWPLRPASKPRRHSRAEPDEWPSEVARWPGMTLYR